MGTPHLNTHYAISALARRFGLSRSALLHYDRIGLLRPSGRSPADYRRYTEADADRLHAILTYRQAGVPLQRIGELLSETSGSSTRTVLLSHLDELNRHISELHAQQARVLALLDTDALPTNPRLLTLDAMVSAFRAAGLDEEGMRRLHAHFEKIDPNAHQCFLESLGLDPKEITKIRQISRS